MRVVAKRFDGLTREFATTSEVVAWAKQDGLADWMQDGDVIRHFEAGEGRRELVVCDELGEESDARIIYEFPVLN